MEKAKLNEETAKDLLSRIDKSVRGYCNQDFVDAIKVRTGLIDLESIYGDVKERKGIEICVVMPQYPHHSIMGAYEYPTVDGDSFIVELTMASPMFAGSLPDGVFIYDRTSCPEYDQTTFASLMDLVIDIVDPKMVSNDVTTNTVKVKNFG